VPECLSGDLVHSYTQHKHTDGPQHIHADVHLANSVKEKKKNFFFVKITNTKFN
jgi:hypothetical protein